MLPSFDKIVNTKSNPEQGSIKIVNVSKKFRKHTLLKKSYSTLKSNLLSKLFQKRYPKENFLHALKNISIDIPAGKSVGIIGSNGSGKSTLLKLIAGIYRADQGEVRVNGKISALIELGAGFHPDFTGRENVYLGGVMYGLTRKQIDERFSDIVKYAELEDFIDDPVRTYSSGMYMRLGFSLAVHTDPDILLVDEVLAVGDASFVKRCQDTISELKRRGKTLILVTHDLESVTKWCDEAIWLEKGDIKLRGEPRYVIDSYIEQVQSKEEADLTDVNENNLDLTQVSSEAENESKRWGNKDIEITQVKMLNQRNEAKWIFDIEDSISVEVHFEMAKYLEDIVFGVGILRSDGLVVYGTNTLIKKMEVPVPANTPDNKFPLKGSFKFKIKRLGLLDDTYYLDIAAHRSDGLAYDYHHLKYKFSVHSKIKHAGIYSPEHQWEFQADYLAEPKVINEVMQTKAAIND